ncbi:hypothetical protein RRG08_054959 [Elysia crispata]|uniref:Uncharacterized protein n=1 Tax=Elysia crispata TaxID=231223 RepID=A0AAE1ASE6_9GAST|nr:hypothetical protein RRG08_054959 [Elysia crispata]
MKNLLDCLQFRPLYTVPEHNSRKLAGLSTVPSSLHCAGAQHSVLFTLCQSTTVENWLDSLQFRPLYTVPEHNSRKLAGLSTVPSSLHCARAQHSVLFTLCQSTTVENWLDSLQFRPLYTVPEHNNRKLAGLSTVPSSLHYICGKARVGTPSKAKAGICSKAHAGTLSIARAGTLSKSRTGIRCKAREGPPIKARAAATSRARTSKARAHTHYKACAGTLYKARASTPSEARAGTHYKARSGKHYKSRAGTLYTARAGTPGKAHAGTLIKLVQDSAWVDNGSTLTLSSQDCTVSRGTTVTAQDARVIEH